MPYSKLVNPVAFPPGRANLSTKPAPTGSGTIVNTTGMLRVAWSNGSVDAPPGAKITSGTSATGDAALLLFTGVQIVRLPVPAVLASSGL
jgi:hypothetical protein